MNTTFVTTAIDYPNAKPHIGTAFEKIGADVYARFRRFQGRDVYFSMGNDENTVKVLKAASGDVKAYVNQMAESFKAAWKLLNISNDDFIQTSEERHAVAVRHFLQAVHMAGHIEKRPYKAFYCEGCEEFKTANNLINGRCANHLSVPLVEREEENYFFLLSKFKDRVLQLIDSGELAIQPESRLNEVKKFVETELADISISRRNEGWGIPIPWDESQVTYVWFDALLSYFTVIGFGSDEEKFNKYWPAEVHFIGKDITRFHCALFPAMCMAYNEATESPSHAPFALPRRVFAHGFVNQKKDNEIVKVSKSGTAVDPVSLVEEYGADAYRYYFLSKLNFDGDGEYSAEHFREVYNSDLANALGNLVSRTVGMAVQYCDGKLPSKPHMLPHFNAEEYAAGIEACSYRQVLDGIWKIIASANQFIEEKKPWALAKADMEMCSDTLFSLAARLRTIAVLLRPFMPVVAEKIYNIFRWPDAWNDLQWQAFVEKPHCLANELVVNPDCLDSQRKFAPLFPRR